MLSVFTTFVDCKLLCFGKTLKFQLKFLGNLVANVCNKFISKLCTLCEFVQTVIIIPSSQGEKERVCIIFQDQIYKISKGLLKMSNFIICNNMICKGPKKRWLVRWIALYLSIGVAFLREERICQRKCVTPRRIEQRPHLRSYVCSFVWLCWVYRFRHSLAFEKRL